MDNFSTYHKKIVDAYVLLKQAKLITPNNSFLPVVHYPPITKYPPAINQKLLDSYSPLKGNLLDLYVHFPFCKQHCVFCHYPGLVGEQTEEKDKYISYLLKELDIYKQKLNTTKLQIRTILIGGGTPTNMTPKQIKGFLSTLTGKLDMRHSTQFNYDVDPLSLIDTNGSERLDILKKYGVNRLTIGIQSFDDKILKHMNRPHTAQMARDAIKMAKQKGFIVNIEFIFGYPEQTIEQWQKTIEEAIALNVEEIQLYRLKINPYGDFTGQIKMTHDNKSAIFPELDTILKMKSLAMYLLKANGYNENLRRVFSKERKIFSHYADNQCCKLLDQIGIGLTAFSSLHDRFILNTQNFDEYYSLIDLEKLPYNRGLIRSNTDQRIWALVLPLKNRELNKNLFMERTGIDIHTVFGEKISKLKELELIQETNTIIKLTEIGAFFADDICCSFYPTKYLS